jgi:SAP domain
MLIQQIEEKVSLTLKKYVKELSLKYEQINPEELIVLWNSLVSNTPSKKSTNAYSKMRKDQLTAVCAEMGIDSSGSRQDMIDRIKSNKCETPMVKSTAAKPSEEKGSIIEMIKKSSDKIIITRNKFGLHEHLETGLVFNENREVVGRQDPSGDILQLEEDDFDTCHRFNFNYVIPDSFGIQEGDDALDLIDTEFKDSFCDDADE